MKLRPFLLITALICTGRPSFATPAANIEIIGHRGARAVLPVNVLVVHHDQTINTENCQYKDGREVPKNLFIRELTLAQVKQFDCGVKSNPQFPTQQAAPDSEIPTLSEVFEMAKTEKGTPILFTIEPKSDPTFPERQPIPSEFAELILKEVQNFDLEQIAAVSKANIISPYFKLLTKENVAAIHKAGFKVIPWTVNSNQDFTQVIDMGVDGIITDDPAPLMKRLNRI